MSILTSLSLLAPCSHLNPSKANHSKSRTNALSIPSISIIPCKLSKGFAQNNKRSLRSKTRNVKSLRDAINLNSPSFEEETEPPSEWVDEGENDLIFDLVDEDEEDIGTPWEGALIYKRNPSITHVEYCTTLERLGLEKLSTKVSKSKASVMGLRMTKAVKDYPDGTPVQVSIDVTRKKQRLRLDGIIKTVITLDCKRCGVEAAESIFVNFSLLLSEEPVEEPEIVDMEDIFVDGKLNLSRSNVANGDDDEDIDLEDRLYFPSEEKEIDISKHIRDWIHLEITLNAVCDPMCKGFCFECGTNLNTGSCNCGGNEVKKKGVGLLGRKINKQMKKK